MGQHGDLGVGPFDSVERWWRMPGHSHPSPWTQVTQRPPALIGQERVVRCRVDLAAGPEADAENLFDAAGEHVRQRARYQPQLFVEGPYRDVTLAGGQQFAEPDLRSGVSAENPRLGSEA